ncbi:MAG: acyl-CoA dehydrogenase family protein [Candidatus Freyarchaeota archaeon]|nr:acyl-CoA dehydrogenase family protein [Candidatus Jordarchaeia archaeon]MBS7268213.1 acyl-CoA dehydrogenase family protein [Candidatus Jordarchaeia archaeon]
MTKIFFTKEELRFREEVREFARREIAPYADDVEKGMYPGPLLKKIAEAGYMRQLHPIEYGGTNKGLVYEMIVAEEIAAVSAPTDMSRTASSTLCAIPISRFGTDEQKRKYLTPIIRGEMIGAIGITEPDVGSDTAGMKTRAIREGDEYVINGEKRFITNGADANIITLFAISNPEVPAKRGASAFIFPTDTEGFKVEKVYNLLGMHGMRIAHLKFENCRIPAENLLGKEGMGFNILMDELDTERISIAAEMIGIARAAFEIAVKYSTERVQFNRPINWFEGISFKIADMATLLDAAELLTLRAARMVNRGESASKESAMAKVFAVDHAFEICNQALQVLGGIGYTTEYPVERYLRDVRIGMIGGGTSEIMRFLIQREVYREFEQKVGKEKQAIPVEVSSTSGRENS